MIIDLIIQTTLETLDFDVWDMSDAIGVSMSESGDDVDFDFGLATAYTGDYDVVPQKGEQVLPTANKTMLSDFTIDPIPYSDVDNQSGGRTVTIA